MNKLLLLLGLFLHVFVYGQTTAVSTAKSYSITTKPITAVSSPQYYSIRGGGSVSKVSAPQYYSINKGFSNVATRSQEISPAMQKYFKDKSEYSNYSRSSAETVQPATATAAVKSNAVYAYSMPRNYKIGVRSPASQPTATQVNKPVQSTETALEITEKVETKLTKRALIIGNNNYTHSAKLRNPINDANAMEKTLKLLGFEVIKLNDVTFTSFQKVLKQYADSVINADVTLFYFAGHGIQVDNINYLLPVNAKVEKKEHIPFEAVSVEQVLNLTDNGRANRLNIVILDACRNNPFKTWERGGDVGLQSINPPSGSLIAYATSPNSVASDGEGDNGLYTGELIKQLLISQRIEDVFINTRINVENISWKLQSPWELARLRGIYNLHD